MNKGMENKKTALVAAIIIVGSLVFVALGHYLSRYFFSYLYGSDGGDYNVLTPVCMIACFLFYESALFLIYFIAERREKRSFLDKLSDDVLEDELTTTEDSSPDDTTEADPKEANREEETKALLLPDEKEEKNESAEEQQDEEDDVVFNEDIFLPLYGDYSMDQLKAMMKLGKYVENVDAEMLRKMFRKDMSAEEIGSIIAIYYE